LKLDRLGLAVIALAMFVAVSTASADSGIGITPGRIQVNDVLKPGGRYELPSLAVINTGDEKQTYEVVLSFEDGNGLQRPAPSWMKIEPKKFALDGQESRSVSVNISLPGGVEPGDYFAYLEAKMVNDSGQSIHASVATQLAFTVGESGWLDTLVRQINNLLDDASPWIYIVAAGGLAVAALRWSSRRVRFRLPFEPR